MREFEPRKIVLEAVKEVEQRLKIMAEDRNASSTSVIQKNAYRLNRLLHRANLHLTSFQKMRALNRSIMEMYSCAGTVRIALEEPQLFSQVHDLLADEDSRQCLEWLLKYRTAHALVGPTANRVFAPQYSDEEYEAAVARLSKQGLFKTFGLDPEPAGFTISATFAFEQYALSGRVEVEQGDGVLDIGAFVGDTAVWFAQKGARFVYAFEPDPANFRKLIRVINRTRLSSKIVPVNLAVGSQCAKVKLAAGGGGGSAVADAGIVVNLTTIDRFIEEKDLQKVDFIKMDIEGFELEALKGAVKTIEKFKPKLAICVYHRPEDLVEIPLFLKELLPDAKFYLSHKSHTWADTVLFVNPR